jgi:signal transduction histidine kinase
MPRTFIAILSLLLLLTGAPACAEEPGTTEEAVAMVHRVQARFKAQGAEATFRAVTAQEKDFKDRDLYPFIYTLDGWNVAHGANSKLVGKLLIKTKDQDGNYLIQLMVRIAQETGSGWVDYKWPHPLTHKIQDKSAYVEKLGDRWFVGVGVYK